MSTYVLRLPVSLLVIVTLYFLTVPFSAQADQIEDIPENDAQAQTISEATTVPADWKQFAGTAGSNEKTTDSSVSQKPADSTEKTELDHHALEKAVQEQEAATKAATETKGAEKTVSHRLTDEKPITSSDEKKSAGHVQTPASTNRNVESRSTSPWLGFLASIGLHDDREIIPPREIKKSQLDLGQDYIIGPGDLLGISVWRDESLTKTAVVLPDGKIQFPLIGEIVAGGKTILQLKHEFVEKLSSYVIDADISVEVKQSNSLLIYIIGRVNSPGRQILLADTTVLQALAMAGGLNPFAEKDDIKIFRQEKDRTSVYSFRYSQVVSGKYLDDNMFLKRGDVIVVP